MGTGKTAVGEILQVRLNRSLRDNDATLRGRTGREAVQIEREEGLAALHAHEAEALIADLEHPEPAVVTAAASTVLHPGARAALTRRAIVVWLDADPAVSARRMRAGTHRPTLGGSVDEDATLRVAALRAERARWFEHVADLVVDTSTRTPSEVADEILRFVTTNGGEPGA